MAEIINTQQCAYLAHYGTVFYYRADMRYGVLACHHNLPINCLAGDIMEFGAWHHQNIWPGLNGFQGYDAVKVEVRPCKADSRLLDPTKPLSDEELFQYCKAA